MQALNILYVSDPTGDNTNSAIASALDPHTMKPRTAQEALAMYTLYFPEVIVLEGHSEMTREVFYHLSSGVTETSPLGIELMLVIDDGDGDRDGKAWQTPPNTLLKRLPANASPDNVLAAIDALVAAREAAYESAHILEMEADLVA